MQRRRTSSAEATIQKAAFHTDASETKGSDKQKRGRSASRRDGKWKEWKFRGSWWLFKRFRSSCFRLLAVSNQQAWDFRLISRFHTRYNRLLIGTEVCVKAGSHQTGSLWNLCPLNPSPPPPSGGGPPAPLEPGQGHQTTMFGPSRVLVCSPERFRVTSWQKQPWEERSGAPVGVYRGRSRRLAGLNTVAALLRELKAISPLRSTDSSYSAQKKKSVIKLLRRPRLQVSSCSAS